MRPRVAWRVSEGDNGSLAPSGPERPAHRWRFSQLQPLAPGRGLPTCAWRGAGARGRLALVMHRRTHRWSAAQLLCKTSLKGGIKLSCGQAEQTQDGNVGRLPPGPAFSQLVCSTRSTCSTWLPRPWGPFCASTGSLFLPPCVPACTAGVCPPTACLTATITGGRLQLELQLER